MAMLWVLLQKMLMSVHIEARRKIWWSVMKIFFIFNSIYFYRGPCASVSYCSLRLNSILLIGSMDELLFITLTYFPTQLFILEAKSPCPGASTEMPRSFRLLLHLDLALMSNWDDTPAVSLNYWYVLAVSC